MAPGSSAYYPYTLLLAVSGLIFFLVKVYHKKQGIDISLAFMEIPPE